MVVPSRERQQMPYWDKQQLIGAHDARDIPGPGHASEWTSNYMEFDEHYGDTKNIKVFPNPSQHATHGPLVHCYQYLSVVYYVTSHRYTSLRWPSTRTVKREGRKACIECVRW